MSYFRQLISITPRKRIQFPPHTKSVISSFLPIICLVYDVLFIMSVAARWINMPTTHQHIPYFSYLSLILSHFLHMCNVSDFWRAFVYLSYEELFYLDADIEILLNGWAIIHWVGFRLDIFLSMKYLPSYYMVPCLRSVCKRFLKLVTSTGYEADTIILL